MPNYIFTYACQPENSFLHQGLGLQHLAHLRVTKLTYLERLQGIPAFAEAIWEIFDRSLPTAVEEIQEDIHRWYRNKHVLSTNSDRLCIIDMQYYPLDIEIISHFLAKAYSTDIPLSIFAVSRPQLPVIHVSGNEDISQVMVSGDTATVTLEKTQLIDLSVPINVLHLFNSSLVLRNFNELRQSGPGYFFKSSENKMKMADEFHFLSHLPAPLRPFYPQCGEMKQAAEADGYEIEIIPSLDISKLLLNGFFSSKEICVSLVTQIEKYFEVTPIRRVSSDEYTKAMHALFIEKTLNRGKELSSCPVLSQLENIAYIQGWRSLADFTESYVEALQCDIKAHGENELIFAHGDMFFGNMLYDQIKHSLKLIDPRGSNNDEGCWLPRMYDLAKLSHSFLGQYDLMVYDMISISLGNDLRLHLSDSSEHLGSDHLANAFRDFLQRIGIDEKRLRLYEGALFLSMMPLHVECPKRMSMQLLRAMELLTVYSADK